MKTPASASLVLMLIALATAGCSSPPTRPTSEFVLRDPDAAPAPVDETGDAGSTPAEVDAGPSGPATISGSCPSPSECEGTCDGSPVHGVSCPGTCVGTCVEGALCPNRCSGNALDDGGTVGLQWGYCGGTCGGWCEDADWGPEPKASRCQSRCLGYCVGVAIGICTGTCT